MSIPVRIVVLEHAVHERGRLYILSPAGQATLVRHGFTPVALPSP
jgi:hypothetical protein